MSVSSDPEAGQDVEPFVPTLSHTYLMMSVWQQCVTYIECPLLTPVPRELAPVYVARLREILRIQLKEFNAEKRLLTTRRYYACTKYSYFVMTHAYSQILHEIMRELWCLVFAAPRFMLTGAEIQKKISVLRQGDGSTIGQLLFGVIDEFLPPLLEFMNEAKVLHVSQPCACNIK